MSKTFSGESAGNIRSILGAIRSVPVPVAPGQREEHRAQPFITISRQPGAGAWTLAQKLVEYLNIADPGEQPWTCWDRELVEKVSADHRIASELVESLEDASHSWMQDFLSGLSFHTGDEAKVYQRVATTIRALAQVGRVVIVGRGGVFITRNMPGGIHVRLVAPLGRRVEHMAEYLGVSRAEAAVRVREMERNREGFYRRYWPGESLAAENFTLTLNTQTLDEQQCIGCILPLVSAAAGVRAHGAYVR
jgi:cytidylate kinase